jgi:hypothetical protein
MAKILQDTYMKYLQNHNIADILIMNLIIVSYMELVKEYPFDIGGE